MKPGDIVEAKCVCGKTTEGCWDGVAELLECQSCGELVPLMLNRRGRGTSEYAPRSKDVESLIRVMNTYAKTDVRPPRGGRYGDSAIEQREKTYKR